MKIFKIYMLAAASLCMTACSDFLTEYPDTAVPQEQAMTNLEESSSVVIGIYSAFKNPALYSGIYAHSDIQADYVYAAKGTNNTYGELYRWELRPTTSYVNDVYEGFYIIASRCNFFLDYKDQVESTLVTESDKAIFKRRVGDVHFARALAYADLIRLYCEAYDPATADKQLGISLHQTYKNATSVPRSSLKESYEFVLRDLDKAEECLDRVGSDSKFFTKGAAWALKSRVYLYMHEYEKSAEYAQKVMDASYYSLADAITNKFQDSETGEYLTEYDVMWRYDEGDEIIWKVAFTSVDYGGSLGRPFLGFNSSKYYPDFIMGTEVTAKYSSNDYRYKTNFGIISTGHGYEATLLKKHFGNADIDAGVNRLFVNMPKVLRLSEVYLIAAEAHAMLGNTAKANNALNTLRAARILNHTTGNFDGDKLLTEIKNERYLELIMEGFRLSDLKRWKMGFERKVQNNVLDGANEAKLKAPAGRVEYTWPIPQHEIDATQGVVLPNPSNKY